MTESFEREKVLQEKLDFLAASINQARILMIDLNPDGTVLEINAACEKAFGYLPQEMAGRPIWDFLLQTREIEEMKGGFSPSALEKFPFGFIRHFQAKNGSERTTIWTVSLLKDKAGSVQRIRLLGRDVTEQSWLEQRLLKDDVPTRLALEQLPVIIWSVDRDLNLTMSLGKGLATFGMRTGRSGGENLWEVMHTSDPNEVTIANHFRALKGETVRYESERYGYTFQTIIEPLLDEVGAIKGAVGISIDITERKRAETAYRDLAIREKKTRIEAERLSRMKDEFLITLSHELRTPLVPILGWLEILKSSWSGSDDVAVAIETIERNAKSELRLIEDLLDVSRIIAGNLPLNREQVDIRTVARESIENLRLAADAKEIRLVLHSDNRPCILHGDPHRLRQVFWNLLSNALKFTPKGGQVEVGLKRVASFVRVEVHDTGIGIKAEFLPHVFERFWQGDSSNSRRFGGLGLGLALARHLVEAHGGRISVASPGENKGATFTIYFPIAATVQSDDESESQSHSPIPASPR